MPLIDNPTERGELLRNESSETAVDSIQEQASGNSFPGRGTAGAKTLRCGGEI